MAPGTLLVDLGPNVFRPSSPNVWERFEEYCAAYIFENAALMAEEARLYATQSDRELLERMTHGQRHLYVLGTFDSQVNNGGVFQFFFNVPHLADEVARSLRELQSNNLLSAYTAVLAAQKCNAGALIEAQRVGSEDFAKKGPGMPSRRAHQAYENGRLALKGWSDKLEEHYYPKWNETAGRLSYEEATLRLEMCSKVVDYVDKNPREYQILRN